MFKVFLNKGIWNGESSDESTSCALYEKEIALPFVPSENIKIRLKASRAIAPISVYWDAEEEHFVCAMPDEFERFVLSSKVTFEFLKKNAEEKGWVLGEEVDANSMC